MNPLRLYALTVLPVLALVIAGLPLCAAEVSKKAIAPQGAYVAPDLSTYDCAEMDKAPARRTLHIGQVIEGAYYEWNQTYVSIGANETTPGHLACISLLK